MKKTNSNVETHALLQLLEYREKKKAPHGWHSQWVAEGMKWLATGK